MTIEDKPIEELTKVEIADAVVEPLQPAVNSLDESAEELKSMGFRDIDDIDEKEAMQEAMKNVQIQRTLNDIKRNSSDKKSPKDYLEQHALFLSNISNGKTKKDIIQSMTLEHAAAALKTMAKMEIPEPLLKKHLKNLKKKYK